MILAWLLLLTGLTISAVAIYYSVVGLTAIFSAAAIPIIIMGSALEIGKLVCASWLKANWERAPRFMKYYMISAVMVLMLITSMGIFGFLSKAHNDQNLVSGDVQSKIAIYDEKIKTARENIEANRKQLKQMDEAVDQIMGRSTDEKGADKANAVRKSQQRDRQALAKDIEANQKIIASLNDEAAPIRAEIRKVEAEVGPIKYIAKFIYGDKGADENMLEQAVTWIIILIVIVFDPLAVIMLLAAQMTFGWKKTEEDEYLLHKTVPHTETPDPYVADVGEKPTEEEKQPEEIKPEPFIPNSTLWPFPSYEEITPKEKPEENKDPVEQWNEMIAAAEQEVRKENEAVEEASKWAAENPDTVEAVAAEEWAKEQEKPEADFPIEEESKKKDELREEGTGKTNPEGTQVGYIQNEEQGEETLWSRVLNRSNRSTDELYKLYGSGTFDSLKVDEATNPELFKFVEETKIKGPRFNNYSNDKLENFVNKIYELRENQRNNTTGQIV